MKNWATMLMISSLVGGLTVSRPAEAWRFCQHIDAEAAGHDDGDGTTEAHVVGNGGLLHGATTEASFTITGMTGNVADFEGTVDVSSHQASFVVTVTGTFDLATGAFHASGPVGAGTGWFTGVSGTLTFDGVEDFATGDFEEDITGRLCFHFGC
jgi:hypothetical protein